MQRIIIAVTGLIGSGKSTIARYLVEQHNFHHVSFRDFMLGLLIQRGLPLDRQHMRELANQLRKEHGSAYLIQKMLDQVPDKERIVLESIRTTDEVDFLRSIGSHLLAVVAPPELRFQRISQRGTSTDSISYSEFVFDEKKESEGQDGGVQNLPKVVALADYTIDNQNLKLTHQYLDQIIKDIIKNA